MNLEERLELYKTMLRDYKTSLVDCDSSYGLNTHLGMCWYILRKFNFNVYTSMRIILPELYNQKPRTDRKNRPNFWFKDGDIPPRIECIEKAIQECEIKIKERKK